MPDFESELKALRPASPPLDLEDTIQEALQGSQRVSHPMESIVEEAFTLKPFTPICPQDSESTPSPSEDTEFERWLKNALPCPAPAQLETAIESRLRDSFANETDTSQSSSRRWWIASVWTSLAAGIALALSLLDPWTKPSAGTPSISTQDKVDNASNLGGLASNYRSSSRSKATPTSKTSPHHGSSSSRDEPPSATGLKEKTVSQTDSSLTLAEIRGLRHPSDPLTMSSSAPDEQHHSGQTPSDLAHGVGWGRVALSGSANSIAADGNILKTLAEGRLTQLLKTEDRSRVWTLASNNPLGGAPTPSGGTQGPSNPNNPPPTETLASSSNSSNQRKSESVFPSQQGTASNTAEFLQDPLNTANLDQNSNLKSTGESLSTATSIPWERLQDAGFDLDMRRVFESGPILIEDDSLTLELQAGSDGTVKASLLSKSDGTKLSSASEVLILKDIFQVKDGLWNGALLNALGMRLANEAKINLGLPTTPDSLPTLQPGD